MTSIGFAGTILLLFKHSSMPKCIRISLRINYLTADVLTLGAGLVSVSS